MLRKSIWYLLCVFALAPLVLIALTDAAGQGGGVVRRYPLNYSGVQDINRPATPTSVMWFDNRVQSSYTSETGGHAFTITGSPVRVYDGTWPGSIPSDNYYYDMDGVADYLGITQAASGGDFNPSASFTIHAVVTPDTVAAGNDTIAGVWNGTGNQRGWVLYRESDDVWLSVSDNGQSGAGNQSSLACTSCLTAGSTAYITATYAYTADGSSTAKIYVDNYATVTDATFDGNVHASTSDFRIGSDGSGAAFWEGLIHNVTWHDGVVWTETQHDQIMNRQLSRRSLSPTMITDMDPDPTGTYVTDRGGYTLTVGGAPDRYEDIYTAQGLGYRFNGTTDYFKRTDDDTFDPSADFSWFGNLNVLRSGTDFVVSKWQTSGNQRGWQVYFDGTDLKFVMTKDGATTQSCSHAGLPTFGTVNVFITYDYVTDGTSVMRCCVDGSCTTAAGKPGPVHNSTASFMFGGNREGVSKGKVGINYSAYYDGKVLSDDEMDTMIAQWSGVMASDGSQVVTNTSATPPAVWTAPGVLGDGFLVDMSANMTQIGSPARGSGGLQGSPDITNFVHRSTFETCTQNGNTEPDGWTVTETPNAGTADAYCSTADYAHGLQGIRLDTTVDGQISIASNCMTSGIGSDIVATAWAKKLSGTSNFTGLIHEHNNPSCSGPITQTTILGPVDVSISWEKLEGKLPAATWDGATQGYYLEITVDTTASEVILDAVQIIQDDEYTDAYCGADTDASAVCNANIYDYQTTLTAGQWDIRAEVRNPEDWATATTPERYIHFTPGTAGDNNRVDFMIDSDLVYCDVYTSAGVQKTSSVAAAGNANTDYSVGCYHHADGRIAACYEGSCGTETADALNTTPDTTSNLTSNASTGTNTWIRDLVFLRRVLR